MSFDPNMASPVFDAEPIEHHQIEATSIGVLDEFFAGYFNAKIHTVGTTPYLFPGVELNYQANPGKQPLNGASIHVISSTPKTERKFYIPQDGNSKLWFFNRQEWAVIVRAAVSGRRPDNHNSESLCRTVADLVYALLTTPTATLHLNRMGFQHLRCDPPQPMASAEYQMRRIVLRGKLRCVEGSGGGRLAANEGFLAVKPSPEKPEGFLAAP